MPDARWVRSISKPSWSMGMYSSGHVCHVSDCILNVLPPLKAGKHHRAYCMCNNTHSIVKSISIGTQKCVHRTVVRCAICVQLVGVHVSCSSHSDAHLAAVFIDPRAE